MAVKFAPLLCLLACAASPPPAAPEEPVAAVSDSEAEVEVIQEMLAKQNGVGQFEAASAQSFWTPYLPDDTMWEKPARTAWYAAQLPAGFPKNGTVYVYYLHKCQPQYPGEDFVTQTGLHWDELAPLLDVASIRNALGSKGITAKNILLEGRNYPHYVPDSSLRTINEDLQQRYETGALAQQLVVLEPFCPMSERNSYEQTLEKWANGGKQGPKPVPPPAAPPPPPPPPPPVAIAPTVFKRPNNSRVWLTSEFKAKMCKVKTGSYYDPGCDWTELMGDSLKLTGRLYRYRVQLPGGPERDGTLDLQTQPSPIDLSN